MISYLESISWEIRWYCKYKENTKNKYIKYIQGTIVQSKMWPICGPKPHVVLMTRDFRSLQLSVGTFCDMGWTSQVFLFFVFSKTMGEWLENWPVLSTNWDQRL